MNNKLNNEQPKIIGLAIASIILSCFITFLYSMNIYVGAVILSLVLMGILTKYEGVSLSC
jgi:hypothetical protein